VPLKNLVPPAIIGAGDAFTIAKYLESALETLHKKWCLLSHLKVEPSPKENSRSGNIFLNFYASYGTHQVVQLVLVSEPIKLESIVHISWWVIYYFFGGGSFDR